MADHSPGLADGITACGTGRQHGHVGAHDAELDGNLRRGTVSQHAGDKQGTDPVWTSAIHDPYLLHNTADSPCAGPNDDRGSTACLTVYDDPGVRYRFSRGDNGELDEPIQSAGLSDVQVGSGIEILYLGSNARTQF